MHLSFQLINICTSVTTDALATSTCIKSYRYFQCSYILPWFERIFQKIKEQFLMYLETNVTL